MPLVQPRGIYCFYTAQLETRRQGGPSAPQLKPEDLRGLTPLFWSHISPYGEVRLDLAARLALSDRG